MSIRRIGFNPFVQTASLIEAQRRVEAVEKHIGADDVELKSEEDILNAINAQHQAELEALEAERAAKERETAELRARLVNVDGFERTQRELLDLKGGTEAAREGVAGAEAGADKPAVTLAHLARASAYAAAARAEQAAAEQAEVERLAAEAASVGGEGNGVEENWMAAELSSLQAELDEVDAAGEAEEAYDDPGADSFFASLEDIENLEEGGADFGDAGANAFVASLDDIAHLVPELAAEVAGSAGVTGVADEPAVLSSDEVAAPAPAVVDSFEPAPVHTAAPAGPVAPAPVAVSAPQVDVAPEGASGSSGDAAVLAPAQVQGEPMPVAASEPEARPVGLPFDDEA
jgi:hypothetical protein